MESRDNQIVERNNHNGNDESGVGSSLDPNLN